LENNRKIEQVLKKKLIIGILLMMGMCFRMEAQNTLNNALQLLQQKNYLSALDICNTLLAQSANDPSALGVRSQINTATGKHDQAMQDADRALSISSTSDRANHAKAEALFYGKKDYKQALQYYDAAIKSNEQMSEAHAGKARAYMGMQNYKDALKVIDDAIKAAFRNDPELHYLRGLLNFQRGNHKLAIDDYDKSLTIDANWSAYQVYLNRGLANDGFGKPDLAVQDFAKAIKADPNNAGGYIARGNVLYNLAKYREAVDDFLKAEVLNPDNSVITYNIGMSYYRGDDKVSACKYFQKSCTQGNSNACRMVVVNCSK
jgi:tetratricopeptide (TPR) repeat protein